MKYYIKHAHWDDGHHYDLHLRLLEPCSQSYIHPIVDAYSRSCKGVWFCGVATHQLPNTIPSQARSSMVFIGQAGKKKVRRAKRAGKFLWGHAHFFFIMMPRQHQHHSVAIRTADTSQHEKISSPVYCQIPALEN